MTHTYTPVYDEFGPVDEAIDWELIQSREDDRREIAEASKPPYYGPYPLLNTTVEHAIVCVCKHCRPELHPTTRVCLRCGGTGTIVTRWGNDGCSPDEDTCTSCRGAGRIRVTPDTTPASA